MAAIAILRYNRFKEAREVFNQRREGGQEAL